MLNGASLLAGALQQAAAAHLSGLPASPPAATALAFKNLGNSLAVIKSGIPALVGIGSKQIDQAIEELTGPGDDSGSPAKEARDGSKADPAPAPQVQSMRGIWGPAPGESDKQWHARLAGNLYEWATYKVLVKKAKELAHERANIWHNPVLLAGWEESLRKSWPQLQQQWSWEADLHATPESQKAYDPAFREWLKNAPESELMNMNLHRDGSVRALVGGSKKGTSFGVNIDWTPAIEGDLNTQEQLRSMAENLRKFYDRKIAETQDKMAQVRERLDQKSSRTDKSGGLHGSDSSNATTGSSKGSSFAQWIDEQGNEHTLIRNADGTKTHTVKTPDGQTHEQVIDNGPNSARSTDADGNTVTSADNGDGTRTVTTTRPNGEKTEETRGPQASSAEWKDEQGNRHTLVSNGDGSRTHTTQTPTGKTTKTTVGNEPNSASSTDADGNTITVTESDEKAVSKSADAGLESSDGDYMRENRPFMPLIQPVTPVLHPGSPGSGSENSKKADPQSSDLTTGGELPSSTADATDRDGTEETEAERRRRITEENRLALEEAIAQRNETLEEIRRQRELDNLSDLLRQLEREENAARRAKDWQRVAQIEEQYWQVHEQYDALQRAYHPVNHELSDKDRLRHQLESWIRQVALRHADVANEDNEARQSRIDFVTGNSAVKFISTAAETYDMTSASEWQADRQVAFAQAKLRLIDRELSDPNTSADEREVLSEMRETAEWQEEAAQAQLRANARLQAAGVAVDGILTFTGGKVFYKLAQGAKWLTGTATRASQWAAARATQTAERAAAGSLSESLAKAAATRAENTAARLTRAAEQDIIRPAAERILGPERTDAAGRVLSRVAEVLNTPLSQLPGTARQGSAAARGSDLAAAAPDAGTQSLLVADQSSGSRAGAHAEQLPAPTGSTPDGGSYGAGPNGNSNHPIGSSQWLDDVPTQPGDIRPVDNDHIFDFINDLESRGLLDEIPGTDILPGPTAPGDGVQSAGLTRRQIDELFQSGPKTREQIIQKTDLVLSGRITPTGHQAAWVARTGPNGTRMLLPSQMPGYYGSRVLGVPGPGVNAAHIDAVRQVANETGQSLVIFGSRQTGIRHRTGTVFTSQSDLDLGVVGTVQQQRIVIRADVENRIPDVTHIPIWRFTSEAEALQRGFVVVRPTL